MLVRLWKREVVPQAGESAAELAGRLFDAGYNCAQAVLQATTGCTDPALLKVAEAFGGGIGDSQCVCGAISGGVMALGLQGRGGCAGELMQAFKARRQVTCCVALSRPYKWNSREHRANCRQITVETAADVERLLRG